MRLHGKERKLAHATRPHQKAARIRLRIQPPVMFSALAQLTFERHPRIGSNRQNSEAQSCNGETRFDQSPQC